MGSSPTNIWTQNQHSETFIEFFVSLQQESGVIPHLLFFFFFFSFLSVQFFFEFSFLQFTNLAENLVTKCFTQQETHKTWRRKSVHLQEKILTTLKQKFRTSHWQKSRVLYPLSFIFPFPSFGQRVLPQSLLFQFWKVLHGVLTAGVNVDVTGISHMTPGVPQGNHYFLCMSVS